MYGYDPTYRPSKTISLETDMSPISAYLNVAQNLQKRYFAFDGSHIVDQRWSLHAEIVGNSEKISIY